jgi:hypothetical protein
VICELVHPALAAVTIYLTTEAPPDVLIRIWEISDPAPELNPLVNDPETNEAVQLKVAPMMLLESWISVLVPEQIVGAEGLADNERT